MHSTTTPRIVALLPIKEHSSRVPGKNFRDFCGKPLFHWILESLLQLQQVSTVVINTDSESLLSSDFRPHSNRLMLRKRAHEICGDEVSMNLVIANDLEAVDADIYLMTHATNPLISTQTFASALSYFQDQLLSGSADSLFSVNRFQSRFYREDLTPVNHDPSNLLPTQDLEPWFEENSCFYIFTRQSFISTNARIGSKPLIYETPPWESVDIDVESDWHFAEALASGAMNHGDSA